MIALLVIKETRPSLDVVESICQIEISQATRVIPVPSPYSMPLGDPGSVLVPTHFYTISGALPNLVTIGVFLKFPDDNIISVASSNTGGIILDSDVIDDATIILDDTIMGG